MSSKIEWLQHQNFIGETWNVSSGCTKISAGCRFCFAESFHKRLGGMGQEKYQQPFNRFLIQPQEFDRPLSWRKPRMIFINSMSDLFHPDMPFVFIGGVFETIAKCWANYTETGKGDHIFFILTKRAERLVRYMDYWFKRCDDDADFAIKNSVWFGFTAENQKCYDERVKWFDHIPMLNRFISFEPLLEPINFTGPHIEDRIKWAIIGCESGPNRRPFNDKWAENIIEPCDAGGIPVFMKQIIRNGAVDKKPNKETWPAKLIRREWPDAFNGRGNDA